jgi:hypothetical protein
LCKFSQTVIAVLILRLIPTISASLPWGQRGRGGKMRNTMSELTYKTQGLGDLSCSRFFGDGQTTSNPVFFAPSFTTLPWGSLNLMSSAPPLTPFDSLLINTVMPRSSQSKADIYRIPNGTSRGARRVLGMIREKQHKNIFAFFFLCPEPVPAVSLLLLSRYLWLKGRSPSVGLTTKKLRAA